VARDQAPRAWKETLFEQVISPLNLGCFWDYVRDFAIREYDDDLRRLGLLDVQLR
jgi:hypothetical protein